MKFTKIWLVVCGAIEYWNCLNHDWFWCVVLGILILAEIFIRD